MIKVEIESSKVNERTFEKEGKVIRFREQNAYVMLGGKYPEQIKLQLGESAAYPPGYYVLDLESFERTRFGSLGLKRELVLKPQQSVKAA